MPWRSCTAAVRYVPYHAVLCLRQVTGRSSGIWRCPEIWGFLKGNVRLQGKQASPRAQASDRRGCGHLPGGPAGPRTLLQPQLARQGSELLVTYGDTWPLTFRPPEGSFDIEEDCWGVGKDFLITWPSGWVLGVWLSVRDPTGGPTHTCPLWGFPVSGGPHPVGAREMLGDREGPRGHARP